MFLHEQILACKYSPIFHALLHLQPHVLGFHILSPLFIYSIYIHTHTIHVELEILVHLPPIFNTFTFIFLNLFWTKDQAYKSGIPLQFPQHLIILTING